MVIICMLVCVVWCVLASMYRVLFVMYYLVDDVCYYVCSAGCVLGELYMMWCVLFIICVLSICRVLFVFLVCVM